MYRSAVLLDDASNAPSSTLTDYCTNCSAAVTMALNDWPVVRKTDNAMISHGFVENNKLMSMLWTTTISNPTSNLLEKFAELFAGQHDDLKKHALKWDATFHDAELIGTIDDPEIAGLGLASSPLLVHWQFNALPLAGREMVYVVSSKDEKPSSSDTFLSRTIYAYSSVKNEWVNTVLERTEIKKTGRVRSLNCFPSVDRVTVYKDRVQLDHLMTTDIGGWVPTYCFNNIFKAALIEANCDESEAMRKYVLSLCGEQKQ